MHSMTALVEDEWLLENFEADTSQIASLGKLKNSRDETGNDR